MNKKNRYLVVLLLMMAGMIESSVITRKMLPDLRKPRYLDIDDKYAYITTNFVQVKCYSLKNDNNRLEIKTRKGQGPGEYHCAPGITVLKDKIIINTTVKTGFYNRDGKYLYEIKKKKFASVFYYLNNNKIKPLYLYDKKKKSNVWRYDLYNSKTEKIKTLFSIKAQKNLKKFFVRVGDKMTRYLVMPWERETKYVDNNKFYFLFADDKIKMFVFDGKGNMLRTIENFNIKKEQISEQDKEQILKRHETNYKYLNSGGSYKRYKKQNLFKFPKYYPRFSKFFVDNNKIYILTHRSKNGLVKTLIFDMDGKKLGEQFLPPPRTNLYKIKNGNFYYVKFCDEEEEWFLHSVRLKY